MAMRFNPPPGWPLSRDGSGPPPGWRPDPSWPAAPPGWRFWIEASESDPGPHPVPPHAGESSRTGERYSRGPWIWVAITVVTAVVVAVVAAVSVGSSGSSEPATMQKLSQNEMVDALIARYCPDDPPPDLTYPTAAGGIPTGDIEYLCWNDEHTAMFTVAADDEGELGRWTETVADAICYSSTVGVYGPNWYATLTSESDATPYTDDGAHLVVCDR